ncbi:MAG TPA: peptide-binding protein [Methylomirabilota bacterium]|nr:peptide-binding protein [Methylomirabilota bacterium]
MRSRITICPTVLATLLLTLAAALPVLGPGAARAAGKDFVIGFLGDATSLNPVVATDGQSYIAEWPMFDSLVELDEKLGVKPLLAESWEVSRDGLTYTFKLRKGVKWHDGKPFTARDVAFTFYSVLDPKVTTPHRAYFDALVGFPELTQKDNPRKPEELPVKPIEVLDDHTVRFRLRYPYGAFLAVLVNPRAGIIPEHLLKGADLNTAEYNRKPVGTGPFKFVEWRRGDRLVMEANADYHGGRPALDRLIYRVIPDAVVLLQELRAGGVDFIERPPLTEVGRLKQTPGLKVLATDNTSYTYFGFRQDLPPFDDLRVRRALYHAVDVPAIVREVLQGYGAVATGQFPPGSWAFDPAVKPYAYDPNRAKALLAEAGWKPGPDGVLAKDGKRFTFSLRHDQADQNVKDTAIIVQEYLKKVGVEARIEPLDWPTFVKKLFASEFEGIVVGWTNFHDPDPFAYSIWHSGQWKGRNFAHYRNPRADAALEAARRAAGQAERKKHYAEFSRILMEDAPYVFLYFPQQVYVTRQTYEGFVPIPAYGGIYQSLKSVRWTGR